MSILEAFLIVIIIIITVVVITNRQKSKTVSTTRTWDCQDRDTGDVTSVSMQYTGAALPAHGAGCKCAKCNNPEKESFAENSEYFTSCQDHAEEKHALSCDDDKFSYAVNEFGAPGMEFKDWVAAQAVGADVIKNHNEFVKDRFNSTTQNITGKTFSPDSHTAQQINYVGLIRPQAVPIHNPTQVPDLDYEWYDTKPRFTWNSS